MRKITALFLATALVLSTVGCSAPKTQSGTKAPETTAQAVQQETQKAVETTKAKETEELEAPGKNIKIGAVLLTDENDCYTAAHIDGIKKAVENLGLSTEKNVIFKYNTPENEKSYDACVDLADQDCNVIITNSYGHQSHCQQAASEIPDIQFIAMTGDTAKSSGLTNLHNAFTRIYQARYVAGVVAGLKLKELIDEKKITDKNKDDKGNYKIGYVGAFPYAEVVSGYSAFYLGIKSVVPTVVMDVTFTNSWSDVSKENEAAIALIDRGCVIIGQHADTTGAPSACEEKLQAGTTVYCVGYNADMLKIAPHAALTSPTNNWDVFYKYAFENVMNGKPFDTNWAKGYDVDAVKITDLGESCAKGTKEKVDEVIAKIKSGELHVFDTNTFTVGGKKLESAFATDTNGDFVNDKDEAVFDGYYHESYFQSAPAFNVEIDGITKLN